MASTTSRLRSVIRAMRLRCPACGHEPLYHGPFRMAPQCAGCGCSFQREPGFYLGAIYINYGATVIGTGLLYAFIVLTLGASHQVALAASLVVAVVFPLLFFRHARALLLALDTSVNRYQSSAAAAVSADSHTTGAGLSQEHLAGLATDDGNAGCMMGIVMALILAFGLLMAGVTIAAAFFGDWFAADAQGADPPPAAVPDDHAPQGGLQEVFWGAKRSRQQSGIVAVESGPDFRAAR